MHRRATGDCIEVRPLLDLCRQGKLREVEAWILAGRPIQYAPTEDRKLRRQPTALQIAVSRGLHLLAELLLATGYDPNGDSCGCLPLAVAAKDHHMVDLLLRFGAEPKSVDFRRVLGTSDRKLMDRFVAAGIDPCHENALARALRSAGRPVFGFIKKYRARFPGIQRQIDIALHVATAVGQLRNIASLLQAGADPHAETSSTAYEDHHAAPHRTAFAQAIIGRQPEVLEMFLKQPIPAERRQTLLALAGFRSQPKLVRRLLKEGANANATDDEGNPVLHTFVHTLLRRLRSRDDDEMARGFEALELVLAAGAKWELSNGQLKRLRRDLASGEGKTVVRLLDILHKSAAVSPEDLHDLTRTPAVRRVLAGIRKQ